MTEPENDSQSNVRTVAARLASELGGYDETPGIPYELSDHLTPTQNALISDAFGLLNGIGFGVIEESQPRIRDDLLQVIDGLSSSAEQESVVQLIRALTSIISRAASCGITADEQSFNTRKRQHLR